MTQRRDPKTGQVVAGSSGGGSGGSSGGVAGDMARLEAKLRHKTRQLRRHAEQQFGAAGGYSAAGWSRLRRDYRRVTGSADSVLGYDRAFLQQFSRNLFMCSPIFRGFIRGYVRRVIGKGLRPVGETPEAKTVVAMFQQWAGENRGADIRRRMTFDRLQRTVLTDALIDGDILPVKVRDPQDTVGGGLHPGGRGGLQLIEAERIGTTLGMQPRTERDGVRLVDGVEVDETTGRALAYRVMRWVPGEQSPAYGDYDTVPAASAMHVAVLDRANQTRGVPLLACALDRLAGMEEYLETVEVAAKLAAAMALVIKTNSTQDSVPGVESAPSDSNEGDTGRRQDNMADIRPGTILHLDPEEDAMSVQGAQPTTTLEMFTGVIVRLMSASVGMPVEAVMGDFSRANLSVAKLAYQAAEEEAHGPRSDFCADFCMPTFRWWYGRMAAAGHVTGSDEEQQIRWQGPPVPQTEPLKEAMAMKTRVENNQSTLEAELADRGRDIGEVFKQRAREVQQQQELGITPAVVPGSAPVVKDDDGAPVERSDGQGTGAPG